MNQQQPAKNKIDEKKDMKGDRTNSLKTSSEQRLDESKAVHDQIYGSETQKTIAGLNKEPA